MNYKDYISITDEQMNQFIDNLNKEESTQDRINELSEFCETYKGLLQETKDINDEMTLADTALALSIIYTGNPELFDSVVEEGYFDDLCKEADVTMQDLKDMADSWDVVKNFYILGQDASGDYATQLNNVRSQFTKPMNSIIDVINHEDVTVHDIVKQLEHMAMQIQLHEDFVKSYYHLNGERKCDVNFVVISLSADLYKVE